MSRALRVQGSQYPFDTRFRAREFYLRGRTLEQVSEELGREADEKALVEATAKGLPAPPPTKRIPTTVISYWSRIGFWESHRGVAERFVEREQLKRIRKEMATEVRGNGTILTFLQGFLQQYFRTEKRDEKGELVLDENKRPIPVPRGPSDWPVDDPIKAVSSMLSIFDKKVTHLRLINEMLGDSLPKIEPSDVHLTPMTAGPVTVEKEEKEKK